MSIHLACDQGDKGAVAQCIAARANVNEADTTGQKPLHYAAAKGFAEIVALLVQNEADPNCKSDRGTTPLHEAAKAGKLDTVVLLLENKAEASITDNEHKSPLHYAIANGHAKVVTRLLEYGADINTPAKDGSTPLHLAASKGVLPLVCLLIEKGARLDARDGRGNTALASLPLAPRPPLDPPSPPRKITGDIKSLLTNVNTKTQGYGDYEEESNEKLFSDVTFIFADGQQINAHRNIVALRCPRLGKMFKPQNPRDRVEVKDTSYATFQAVLEWLYSEEVTQLRSEDPDVPFILSLLVAADRYNLKDLKTQCETTAMRNIGASNLASLWTDLRKCGQASPELRAYTAYLLASGWNVLASTKMAQDMAVPDIVSLVNVLTIGEIKEEAQEKEPLVPNKPAHRVHSPKRKASTHAVHAAETPSRTQPDRSAHRHASPAAAAPVAPPTESVNPFGSNSSALPADFSLLNIGNNNFLADGAAKVEGKNLKNIKNIHNSLLKHKVAWPFLEPVDPIKLGIPNYRDIIKEPMDLTTIKTNLDRESYTYVNQYAYHVRLVFINALKFNQPGYDIYKMAESLLKTFNEKFEKVAWERSSSNGDSYPESASPSTPSANTPSATQGKQKRKSQTFQTPTAPAARASNGHAGSPSPSPPPSPPPARERASREQTPRAAVPPPPPPQEEEMSYEDKKELGNKMHRLEPHQLSHVISILGAKSQSDEDIEIDLDDVSPDKLRVLDKYVNECLFPNGDPKKSKRRHKEDDEDVVIDDQEPEVGNWEQKVGKSEHKHKKKRRDDDDD